MSHCSLAAFGSSLRVATQQNARFADINCQAQTDIVTSDQFLLHLNVMHLIRLIEDIFTKTKQCELATGLEPTRPVHEPWEEVDLDNKVEWEPPPDDKYTGELGGGVCGPTNDVQVFVSEGQSPPRNARHRAYKPPVKPDITPNYIIVWVAICILAGAFAGCKNNRIIKNMYRSTPYGYFIPYIQNAMTEPHFIFLRRCLHFAHNSKRKKRGEAGHDILFKVRHVLDEIIKGLQKSWNAGERVTINESMIRYNSRAVDSVQYLPNKRIKHSLRVFAI